MKRTKQQEICVAMSKEPAGILKIEAGAGAGKTSTLVECAKENIRRSIYLAFNKVTAEEARERFPDHVTASTTHSVAYRAYGVALQHKLTRPKGGYKNVAGTGSEIAKYYNLQDEWQDGKRIATANAMGLFVKQTVERFQQSADREISYKHVPVKDAEDVRRESPMAISRIVDCAKKLWKDRIDTNSIVLASHDTYLKQYQLSNPHISHEIIYVDEFQDTTPCVLDIVLRQTHAKIIVVGDRRQAIYGWRGAVNAMQMINAPTAMLSQSFRYGQGIADVASAILDYDMILTGREDIKCVIGYQVVDRTKPHMYLFRTNAVLLMEAVAAIDRGEKVKVEIDVKDFVKVLQSAQALYNNDMKNVKHENILQFLNWKDLVEEAEDVGGELKRLVAIVEGQQADHFIDVLEHYHNPDDAIAIYTTAHKAKGREEEQVILASDYPSCWEGNKWKGLNEVEQNLLYVAATRAKRVLEINKTLADILDHHSIEYGEEKDWDTTPKEDTSSYEYVAANYEALSAKADEIDAAILAAGGYNNVMRGEHAIEAMHREMGLSDGDMHGKPVTLEDI